MPLIRPLPLLLGTIILTALSQSQASADAGTSKKSMIHSCLLGIALAHNRSSDAQNEYVALLRLAPRDPKLHYDYGMFLWQDGHLAVAASQMREASSLDPGNSLYKHKAAELNQYLEEKQKAEHNNQQIQKLRAQPSTPLEEDAD